MKTMKKYLSMVALALVGALMTGCSSDDNEPQQPANTGNVETLTLTVSLDGEGTRALTYEGVKTFAVGDQIAVVYKNTDNETVKTVSNALSVGGSTATFTVTVENADKTEDVTYIYPASMANADGSINYAALATQDGTLATLSSNLDLATYTGAWDGTSLPSNVELDNPLAILQLTLKNSDGTSTITSGLTQVTVSDGSNTYTVTPTGSNFGEDVIYVAIRPVTAALQYTATDGTYNYLKTATSRAYAAGNFYDLGLRMTKQVSLPTGAINGLFSVSSTQQVYFSQGNLQATYNGSAWSWAFATNQYDYVGSAAANTLINGNNTVSDAGYNKPVDLFCWVDNTSSLAAYGINISTTGYGTSTSDNLKSDWGTNMGSPWRTLTKDEWNYLFTDRTDANLKYGHGSIGGVKGLIILPDVWTLPTSLTFTALNTSWDNNRYTTEQWSQMEAAGAVFLPCAGIRSGTSISYPGTYGYYWSSTPYTSGNKAWDLLIGADAGIGKYDNQRRYKGLSVRLVCNAN